MPENEIEFDIERDAGKVREAISFVRRLHGDTGWEPDVLLATMTGHGQFLATAFEAMVRATQAVANLLVERDKQLAVVKKTLDGKVIVNGMKVYQPPFREGDVPWPALVTNKPTASDRPFILCGDVRDDIDPTECYSTKSLAEESTKPEAPDE